MSSLAARQVRRTYRRHWLVAGAVALAITLAALRSVPATPSTAMVKPPETLKETGLYADFATLQVDTGHLAFAPRYPLWTDGATKRRWLSLPPGSAIDGSEPDDWVFPIGTRLWKEFSFAGRRIETRYIERRPDGQWLYAAYAWSEDSREARLVDAEGKRGAYPLGKRRAHAIPSVNDCKACHQGSRTQVLGFSAFQLAPRRDRQAPHAEEPNAAHVDLEALTARGLLVGFPKSLQDLPPQNSASPTERAALGYLHGNCGHCHNEQGPLKNLGLFLRHKSGAPVQPALASTVGHAIKNRAPGQSAEAVLRVEPQHPERSALMQRMASRYPPLQMPPLGTELVDNEAVELLRRWITEVNEASGEAPKEE